MNLRTTPGAELAFPAPYTADSGTCRPPQQTEECTSFRRLLDGDRDPPKSATPSPGTPTDDESFPVEPRDGTQRKSNRKPSSNDRESEPILTETLVPWPVSQPLPCCVEMTQEESPTNAAASAGQNFPTPPTIFPGMVDSSSIGSTSAGPEAKSQLTQPALEAMEQQPQPTGGLKVDTTDGEELAKKQIGLEPLSSNSPTEPRFADKQHRGKPEARLDMGGGTTVAKATEAMNTLADQTSATQQATPLGALPLRGVLGAGGSIEQVDAASYQAFNFTNSTAAPGDEVGGAEAPVERVERSFPTEALRQEIRHHISVLKQVGLESMAVVLKPDRATELLLQLKRTDGKVEAVAHCERGDFQLLSSHWSELRAQLQQQGVELQDLRSRSAEAELSAGTGSERHDREGNPHSQLDGDGSSDPLQKSITRTGVSPNLRQNPRLLESWA